MKPTARVRVLVVLVLALVAGGTYFYRTGKLRAKQAPLDYVTLYGNVDIRQVELGFRVAGRLQSAKLEEGETVKAGAVMATLSSRNFEDELRADEAQVDAYEATLKKLIAGSRPAEIARAKASVDEAAAASINAHVTEERLKKLVDAGASPGANLDDAVAAARMADARVAGANEALRLLRQGSRSEDIDAARAELRVAKARVDAAKTALADTQLIAPSDGVVISRVKEPGAIVSPNDIIYVLSLTNATWVRAYVSESLLGKVRPGLEVQLYSDGAPGRGIKGHVGFISPTAEFTPKSVETPDLRTDLVYRIRIIVDEADSGLRQGMPVTVRIKTGGV